MLPKPRIAPTSFILELNSKQNFLPKETLATVAPNGFHILIPLRRRPHELLCTVRLQVQGQLARVEVTALVPYHRYDELLTAEQAESLLAAMRSVTSAPIA